MSCSLGSAPVKSQRRTVPSQLLDARVPFGANAIDTTARVCPRGGNRSAGAAPVRSHKRTVLSLPAVNSDLPAGV